MQYACLVPSQKLCSALLVASEQQMNRLQETDLQVHYNKVTKTYNDNNGETITTNIKIISIHWLNI